MSSKKGTKRKGGNAERKAAAKVATNDPKAFAVSSSKQFKDISESERRRIFRDGWFASTDTQKLAWGNQYAQLLALDGFRNWTLHGIYGSFTAKDAEPTPPRLAILCDHQYLPDTYVLWHLTMAVSFGPLSFNSWDSIVCYPDAIKVPFPVSPGVADDKGETLMRTVEEFVEKHRTLPVPHAAAYTIPSK